MQAKTSSPGLLIAFEGIDGCGKSSHLQKLAVFLREQGLTVVETKEPTNGPFGQKIRQMFTQRALLRQEEELELFLRDRKDHVQHCILPALAAGRIVLTDRYYFSNAAYQGAAGLGVERIFAQNSFAPVPHLVLLLQVSPEEGIRRIREKRGETPNDFERLDQLKIASQIFASFQHDFIKRINAEQEAGFVQEQIRRHARCLLRAKGLSCQ